MPSPFFGCPLPQGMPSRPVVAPGRGADGSVAGRRVGDRVDGMANSLLVVHVDVQITPGQIDAFHAATEQNAVASRQEPGVVRFDVLADRGDPGHVVLVEVYRDADAADAHKRTPHYGTWRDTVAPMMARPRSSVQYVNVSPDDADW